ARCEAEAIARSRSSRSSRARAAGIACRGFDEERMKATRPASPASATTAPFSTATACTRWRASTTLPRVTVTTIGSTAPNRIRLVNGLEISYGREMSPIEDYEAEDTLVVSEPEQLRALGAKPRVAIIRLLRE